MRPNQGVALFLQNLLLQQVHYPMIPTDWPPLETPSFRSTTSRNTLSIREISLPPLLSYHAQVVLCTLRQPMEPLAPFHQTYLLFKLGPLLRHQRTLLPSGSATF